MIAHTELPPEPIPVRWLRRVFAHTDEGWVTVFGIADGRRCTHWAPVAEIEQLIPAVAALEPSADLWFGVATRAAHLGNRRGGDVDCLTLPALWLDIDVAHDVHNSADLPASTDEARRLLEDFPLPPTAIVDSGHGLQVWWQFTEPVPAVEAQALLARWAATWAGHARQRGWHLDNVFDLARIMRLPGTTNRKAEPVPVKLLEADWTHTYGSDDIDQFLVDPPAPQDTARTPYIGPPRPGDAFNAVKSGQDVLAAAGWVLGRRDNATGDEHWVRPGKEVRQGTGATVYAEDGHTTIWSDATGLPIRRPLDPFGLHTHMHHGGDWRASSEALAQQGYGTSNRADDDMSWVALSATPDPQTEPAVLDENPLRAAIRLQSRRLITGRDFVLGLPEVPESVWGADVEVLWPKAEPFFLVGPSGVGKTTLMQQVVKARLGGPDVLGWPIEPTASRVLYLAMDRPAQIARSLARMLGEGDGELLDRLKVWRGPLPFSIVKEPHGLSYMAEEFGADTIIVDSIKDLAPKLSDEEVGGQINAAFQLCLVENVEVGAIHHQRKTQGDNKKPTTLADVYGSQMMVNGAGSVILLWGEAGDPVVELTHLKQPMETIGPMTVTHDHTTGRTIPDERPDVLSVLHSAPQGLDAGLVAFMIFETDNPNRSQIEKARRRLERLVETGHARKQEGARGGGAGRRGGEVGGTRTLYYAADPTDGLLATSKQPNSPKNDHEERSRNDHAVQLTSKSPGQTITETITPSDAFPDTDSESTSSECLQNKRSRNDHADRESAGQTITLSITGDPKGSPRQDGAFDALFGSDNEP